ncbi:MAG TPA: alternative ribosome rescue aminoacyl-tRNA hydrolase ArfB [Egibacteraceae bacterium]
MPVRVTSRLEIPDEELSWRFSRSSGPGGQHVNTSATKVELRFDVARSRVLDDEQKRRITERLGSRLTADGVLVLQSSEHRSQARNRQAAEARLATLLAEALRPPRPRRPTAPSRAARQRRLEAKRHRGEVKALRRRPPLP